MLLRVAHAVPSPRGGFGGHSSKPPKLKYETLENSGIFVKFECQDPLHECKPPRTTL